MTKPDGHLTWDINEIAKALKLSATDVREYFTDGRRVSFLLERRIAKEVINGTLAISEGAGYDVIDSDGEKWEVRSISKRGIYFCPSYMVGSGRSFAEKGFLEKLAGMKGYIISDIEAFPEIPFWIIHKDIVISWYKEGCLSSCAKISRDRILQLLKDL